MMENSALTVLRHEVDTVAENLSVPDKLKRRFGGYTPCAADFIAQCTSSADYIIDCLGNFKGAKLTIVRGRHPFTVTVDTAANTVTGMYSNLVYSTVFADSMELHQEMEQRWLNDVNSDT